MYEGTSEFILKRRLATFDGYAVCDTSGTPVFTIKNHLGLKQVTWTYLDANGNEAATLIRPAMHIHPQFQLERPGHGEVTIRKANFALMKETWRIEGTELGDLDIAGDLVDHEYKVTDANGREVGHASRAWVTVHETYGIKVAGIDPTVILAAAMAIDVVENESRR